MAKHNPPIDIRGAKKADLPVLKFDYNSAPLYILRKVVESKPDYEVVQFQLGRPLLQSSDATGAIERLLI
jgi:hypothetical protein